jgi:hypothetical protein
MKIILFDHRIVSGISWYGLQKGEGIEHQEQSEVFLHNSQVEKVVENKPLRAEVSILL